MLGLSQAVEFWKATAKSFMRSCLRCSSLMPSSSRPSSSTWPDTFTPSSQRQLRPLSKVVLPEPDSPTTASISPASMLKDMGWRLNSG